MAIDMTSFDAALKDYYIKKMRLQVQSYRDNVFLGLVPKVKVAGRKVPIAIRSSNGTGGAPDYATALANAVDPKYDSFDVTRVKFYSFANVDRETLLASKDPDGAFAYAKDELDSTAEDHSNSLAIQAYRTAGGSLGRIDSTTTLSSTTLKLATKADVYNFVVGQVLELSSSDGLSGSLKVGSLTVTGVNTDAGTLTTSAALNSGVASVAANDYIFVDGHFGAVLTGMDDWIGTRTPLFGVDRTIDVTRRGGQVLAAQGMSVKEALIKAAVAAGRQGGKPTHVFCSFDKFAELQLEEESIRRITETSTGLKKIGIGYEGMQVEVGGRTVKVLPDINCQPNKAFMVSLADWMMMYVGNDLVDMIGEDGQVLRHGTNNTDTFQARFASISQLACKKIAGQVKIDWDLAA